MSFCLCVSGDQPLVASVDLSGTDSALYPYDSAHESSSNDHSNSNNNNRGQEVWSLPTSAYPYFLFEGTAGPRMSPSYYELDADLFSSLEEQIQQTNDADSPVSGRPKLILYQNSVPQQLKSSLVAIRAFEDERWQTQWLHVIPAPGYENLRHPTTLNPRHYDNNNNDNDDFNEHENRVHSSQHVGQHRHRHQHHHRHNEHKFERTSAPPYALSPTALAPTPASAKKSSTVYHDDNRNNNNNYNDNNNNKNALKRPTDANTTTCNHYYNELDAIAGYEAMQ